MDRVYDRHQGKIAGEHRQVLPMVMDDVKVQCFLDTAGVMNQGQQTVIFFQSGVAEFRREYADQFCPGQAVPGSKKGHIMPPFD